MTLTSLVHLAAESAGEEGVNPWIVGVGAFAILAALLLALISFGGGRDHS